MGPRLSLPRSRPRRLTVELVVLALIFALGGFAGPALAAQVNQVLVTNPASNPVRVAGTVTVGNLPATQAVTGTVSVSNLPATQAVSGTVNVGSAPAPAAISGGATQSGTNSPGEDTTVQVITKVVAVDFWSSGLAYLIISGNGVANGYQITAPGSQSVAQSFFNPLPSDSITVRCDASNTSPCRWRWAVAGIN
jgi:hypothetical protein